MTFRERTLKIFQHKPVDSIVYQPRIEHWYGYNKALGQLPDRYKNMELLDVYDDFETMTRRVIETFSPNLILGISDEPSPVCDIERVRRVVEILEEYSS